MLHRCRHLNAGWDLMVMIAVRLAGAEVGVEFVGQCFGVWSMGVFPQMVVPPKHPKMIILVEKPVSGYHHFRKPPWRQHGNTQRWDWFGVKLNFILLHFTSLHSVDDIACEYPVWAVHKWYAVRFSGLPPQRSLWVTSVFACWQSELND